MIQNDIINMFVDLIPAIFDAHYDDFEFKGRDTLYNYFSELDYEAWNTTLIPKKIIEREDDLWSGNHTFERLANAFPEYPLY